MVSRFLGSRYGRGSIEMFCALNDKLVENNFHLDLSVLGCYFRYNVI